jgi:DNA (cytosine-5)-methyltransferase 1
MTSEKPTVIELFAGAGGLALGFERAGFDAIILNEIDANCVSTLRKNRPNWNVVHEDVKKLSFKGISADVVTGGFPCQAFSYAGKRLGFEDVRGTLFFEFARCVKEVQPKVFVAENVAGLPSHDGGRTFKTMLDILAKEVDSYTVQYRILNAWDYGVAQKRKRIFIVGTKSGFKFNYPEPHKHRPSLKDALANVPQSEGTGYSKRRKEILAHVPAGGCWINLPVELQKEYMGASFTSGGGRRGMARRISWDEPSLTLTCSPTQKQTDRIHPEETRPFTVREYARIQSFPDEWNFVGSVVSKYKQIGNAVPVNLAEEVGKCVVDALGDIETIQAKNIPAKQKS